MAEKIAIAGIILFIGLSLLSIAAMLTGGPCPGNPYC